MTVRLSIKAQDAEVKAALGRAARAADGLTELMDRIGGALVASTQGRFADQRARSASRGSAPPSGGDRRA